MFLKQVKQFLSTKNDINLMSMMTCKTTTLWCFNAKYIFFLFLRHFIHFSSLTFWSMICYFLPQIFFYNDIETLAQKTKEKGFAGFVTILIFQGAATMVIIFWEFLMFYQFFLSPEVKRSLIISNKLVLPELPNDLDLGS